jgi:hypothetical protein
VATSLLVPKEQYVRAAGMQSFSGSTVAILAPALGSAILAFGGMEAVLTVDLATFAIAFITLLFFVRIPDTPRREGEAKESFLKSCSAGIGFLREHPALLRIILFFALINLFAKLGGDGMLPAFVLGKTGGDQRALGMVESAVSLGVLAGSALVTLVKPAKSRTRVIFISCALSFLFGDIGQSLTPSAPYWAVAAILSYAPVAFLNANLTAVMREHVPIEMQGRVFSARDTLQNFTIPLGLFLGGFAIDNAFEPFMAAVRPGSPLRLLFGTGKGSGAALLFFITGITGAAISFINLKKPIYKVLD